MIAAAQSHVHRERVSAMLRAERLEMIEQEIRARAPRPAARLRVSFSSAPGRSAFQAQMRLAGARDDVLDLAAALDDEIRGMVRPDGSLPLMVAAIESESSEHIQLLLSRELYEH